MCPLNSEPDKIRMEWEGSLDLEHKNVLFTQYVRFYVRLILDYYNRLPTK